MREPKYLVADLLYLAIKEATHQFKSPIDRIEMVGSQIQLYAEDEWMTFEGEISHAHADGADERGPVLGAPLLGSGSARVYLVAGPTSRPIHSQRARAPTRRGRLSRWWSLLASK